MLKVATERLYYVDSYLTEFEGKVIGVAADGRRVYLDRTAFYPASGGQPYDTGELGGQPVVEVVDEEDGRVAHILSAATVAVGESVAGKVHWPRRYEHMQQHTGQHLLSAVLMDLYGFQTLSFHMGGEVSTIELATKEISDQQLLAAEMQANELARSARPVRISFEDAAQVEGLRKQSQRAGTLRIIEIEGLDKSACGGTHVRSLAETLPIQVRRVEKVRANVRLEFVCGGRAIRRAKQDFKVLQELARQTATAMDKLPESIAALKERLGEAEKDRQRLAADLAQREGREEYEGTAPSSDGVRRALWQVDRIGEIERLKALAYAAGVRSVVLLVGKEPAGVLIACSADTGLDAGAILKQTLAECGGRGGGSATLAQGSIPDEGCIRALAGKLGMQ
jgi:alanyl-tRNA synthetase